jgi:hypothetical protein
VFGTVRPLPEVHHYLCEQNIGERRRTPKMTLGVKWSQVQILSARPESAGSCGAIAANPRRPAPL